MDANEHLKMGALDQVLASVQASLLILEIADQDDIIGYRTARESELLAIA